MTSNYNNVRAASKPGRSVSYVYFEYVDTALLDGEERASGEGDGRWRGRTSRLGSEEVRHQGKAQTFSAPRPVIDQLIPVLP